MFGVNVSPMFNVSPSRTEIINFLLSIKQNETSYLEIGVRNPEHNFNHIKAYWPMLGKDVSQIALSFGVDDIDGTIDDSTKIYSMAGAKDQKPSMSTNELVDLIKNAASNTAITPGIIMLMEAFLLYAPFLMNFIEAGGIKNAQDPIIIGNATSGDIPKA